MDSHVRPNPNSDMKLREAFILAKYRDKAFVDRISDDALNEGERMEEEGRRKNIENKRRKF